MKKIIEKTHRLPDFMYMGYNIVAYTICIYERHEIFNEKNQSLVSEIIEILKKTCLDYDVKNWIYVFMPEHLHVLLQGRSESADIRKMINMFKQRTGRILKLKTDGKIRWQKDYYDHVLRQEEDLFTQIRYIAENPVRKKMIDKWEDYGYTGSVSFDIKKVINCL